jgi:hypothetical protein
MEVGDWIRSYHSGIWRVYRIVAGFYEPRYSLTSPKAISSRTLVFAQRFVNDRWKRAFSAECYEQSLTVPLEAHERAELDSFIQANPKVFEAFDKATPKAIDLVLNLSFGVPTTVSKDDFSRRCHELLVHRVAQGVTSDQIIGIVSEDQVGTYQDKLPTTATIQFACADHEVVEREFVYRTMRVLSF